MQRDSEFRKGKSAETFTTFLCLQAAIHLVLLSHNILSVCYFWSKLQSNRKGRENLKITGLMSTNVWCNTSAFMFLLEKQRVCIHFQGTGFFGEYWSGEHGSESEDQCKLEKLNSGNRFDPTYWQWAVTSWVSQSLLWCVQAYMYRHVVRRPCSGCLTSVCTRCAYISTQ